jgi:hypothetical protein
VVGAATSTMMGNSVTAKRISASTSQATYVSASTSHATCVSARTIHSKCVSASTIQATYVSASTSHATCVSASTIHAKRVSARTIHAKEIVVGAKKNHPRFALNCDRVHTPRCTQEAPQALFRFRMQNTQCPPRWASNEFGT